MHKPGVEISPHISIFYPFLPVNELIPETEERIQQIVNESFPIAYQLVDSGVFEEAEVLYLRPHPDEAFLALFEGIKSAFPDNANGLGLYEKRDGAWSRVKEYRRNPNI